LTLEPENSSDVLEIMLNISYRIHFGFVYTVEVSPSLTYESKPKK